MRARLGGVWPGVVRASIVCAATVATVGLTSCGGVDEIELNARAADLDRRIDGMLTEMRSIATQVDGIAAGLADIQRAVEEVGGRIGPVGAPIDEELALIVERSEAFAMSVEERLAEIDARFEEMAQVVDGRVAMVPAFGDVTAETPSGDRIIAIEVVETLPGDESKLGEAATLRNEAKKLNDRITGLETKRRELMRDDRPLWWGSANNERRRAWELERRRQREAIGVEMAQLRTDTRRLETRAGALEKEGAMVRHRITGWDGTTMVVLETTRDLSAVVSKAQTDGSALAWRGHVVERDATRELWRVDVLMARPQPVGLGRSFR